MISFKAKRERTEGRANLKGINWGDEIGNDVMKIFARNLEVTLEDIFDSNPPHMHLQDNTRVGDVNLMFALNLSNKGVGPAWTFSLKEALENGCAECSPEIITNLVKSLRLLADYAERENAQYNKSRL